MPESAPQIQFRQQFVNGLGQTETYLRETVTTEANVRGLQATFLIANNNATTVSRGLNGDIPYQRNDTTQTTLTLEEDHAAAAQTNFNIETSQGDQSRILQWRNSAAMNRKIDERIVAAIGTTTQVTAAAAAASLNWFSAAREILMAQEVPRDQITFLITTKAEMQLIRAGQFTSADFVSTRPLEMAGARGNSPAGYYNFMGTRIIVMPRLPGAGTNAAQCLMYHRDAVGHAYTKGNLDVQSGYDAKQDESWSRVTFYQGARLLLNNGALRVLHDDTAA